MSNHDHADPIVLNTRRRLQLSQKKFARRFGFNLTTLQQWEQGLRRPAGPSRVLLMVIAHAPDVVDQAIKDARGTAEMA
jgi:putative transcriptional regulator